MYFSKLEVAEQIIIQIRKLRELHNYGPLQLFASGIKFRWGHPISKRPIPIQLFGISHPPVQIQLWDANETTRYVDLDDIPDDYYRKIKDSGRYLVIKLSRQGLNY